ncbi:MAG TPA: hypothetical protein VHP32_08050 [Ignavibacteria bacterium]|nr:hypothetical protein [Ignavibacteria bacterium]
MKREHLIKNLDVLIVEKFVHKKNKELLEQKFKELNFKKEFSEDKINFGFNGYSKKIDSLDNLMHSLNDLFEDIIFFNEDDKVILFYPKTEKKNLNTSLKKIELLKNGKNNIMNYISISGDVTRVNRY